MERKINDYDYNDIVVARDVKYGIAGIVVDVDEGMNELLIDFQGMLVKMKPDDIVALPIPSCHDSLKMDLQIFSDRKRFSDVLAVAIVNENYLVASSLIEKQFPVMAIIDISRLIGKLNEI